MESQRRGTAFILFGVLLILALALVGCETVASPTTTGATGVGPGTAAANNTAGPQVETGDTPPGTNLRYGEIMRLDGLEIAVTVAPSEVGQYANGVPRLRSQVIVENRGSEPREIRWSAFWLLDAGNNRIGPYGVSREALMAIDPGARVIQQLDWQITRGREIVKVVYAPDGMMPEEVYRWGPEAIAEGPGYPVLQTLPPLRAEDVQSIQVREDDPKGGEPSIETYSPEAADLETFIQYYKQTTLVPSEGYPGYGLPIQVTFHLLGGSDFIIWIASPGGDRIIIEDTRGSAGSNPASAVGINPALVNAYHTGGTSETVTTSGVAHTTDSPPDSTTTSTSSAQGPKLKWGEAAVLGGRTVRVDEPIEDAEATGSRPGSKVVYSMVTITNTGSKALTFVASELFLEGNSSGSTGIGGPEKTVDGHPVLDSVTLAPGASVTAAVRFSLKQGDEPVKVRLVTASSTNVALASWQ